MIVYDIKNDMIFFISVENINNQMALNFTKKLVNKCNVLKNFRHCFRRIVVILQGFISVYFTEMTNMLAMI